ncbi:uncharacterized protein LTR77_008265 [Saxophila tyrrhenica]|uniref:Protein kinase domain-containing protein n=1 Tax=Saxophila tyrrhenica TaxID=1690608 RepID=A0AAV9P539_9PEZI|nr:hypothetical protein LTR77_008265 [Saxophila tyrrhenica]
MSAQYPGKVSLEQCSRLPDGSNEATEIAVQGVRVDGGEDEARLSTEKMATLPERPDGPGVPVDDTPDIRSKRDLAVLSEIEDAETGAFLRSTHGYIDHSGAAWFGRLPGVRKHDLTVEDLKRTLKQIPDEQIYSLATPSITAFHPRSGDVTSIYIKRPQLTGFDDADVAALLPGLLIEEAKLLEFLKPRPHSNLIRYHGCTLKDGRVTGLALDKYDVLLLYRYEDRPLPFNTAACMDGIRAGVEHLHSLGLAHNDLNPMNVLLDKDDRPVIIDFGSCKRFGEQLVSAGTPGWIDEEYAVSAQENDEVALRKIEFWLAAQSKNSDLALYRCWL